MKKKNEKAYFNDQWKLMLAHFKSFIKTDAQEELHLFRVQVKKLRAMLELLDIVSSKPYLSKDFKPVKKIFKHGGDIRSAYVNLQFGVRYQLKNEEFLMGQLYTMETGTNDFKIFGRKYLKAIKEAHHEIADDLRPVDNKAIVGFYKTRLDEIAIALDKLQFNDGLHDTRKQIKMLVYNRKLAQEALDGKLHIDNDYLDKLQDTIGNWHDNILALELFSSEGVAHKPIITKIKRQNIRLKRSITVLAQNFEKKAVLSGTL